MTVAERLHHAEALLERAEQQVGTPAARDLAAIAEAHAALASAEASVGRTA